MPFNTTARDALSVGGNKYASSLLAGIEGEYVWTPQPSQTVTDLVPGLTRVIAYGGKLFVRDDADTTTPHDGVACIVTQGGVRFKVTDYGQGPTVRRFAVLAITTTPPASPAVGDTHIVGVGASGVWAGKDGKVSHRTSAGWVYVTPKLYDEAHVAAISQIYHFNASSAWVAGVPALSIADASVPFTKLMHGLGFAVENQTTNAPPGSPSDKVAYIIGPSPSGAFAGHAFKIAYYISASWLIVTPQIGWHVYDKTLKTEVVYGVAGWELTLSGYVNIAESSIANSTGVSQGGGYYGFSATAPTTSNMLLQHSMSYTPSRAGRKIEIEVQIGSTNATSTSGVSTDCNIEVNYGLFIDSNATAEDWAQSHFDRWTASSAPSRLTIGGGARMTFVWTAPDASIHTIKLYGAASGSPSSFDFGVLSSRIRMIARERI